VENCFGLSWREGPHSLPRKLLMEYRSVSYSFTHPLFVFIIQVAAFVAKFANNSVFIAYIASSQNNIAVLGI